MFENKFKGRKPHPRDDQHIGNEQGWLLKFAKFELLVVMLIG